jgi:hypothetical protein
MTTKKTAIGAYLDKTAAIQEKIAQLKQLADNKFYHDADNINWGHVGDLGRIESALDEIIDYNF